VGERGPHLLDGGSSSLAPLGAHAIGVHASPPGDFEMAADVALGVLDPLDGAAYETGYTIEPVGVGSHECHETPPIQCLIFVPDMARLSVQFQFLT
jgi:hypothetical protein